MRRWFTVRASLLLIMWSTPSAGESQQPACRIARPPPEHAPGAAGESAASQNIPRRAMGGAGTLTFRNGRSPPATPGGGVAAAIGPARVAGVGAVEGGTQPVPIEQPALRPPPAPDAAMACFRAVQGWVRAWEVPDHDPPDVLVLDGAGAAVTLRLDGAVVGRGASLGGPGAGVRRAARAALDEAAERVPVERDALFREKLLELAPRLTISLELAGTLVPIAPGTWADATASLDPGLDGVAARIGERVEGVFPAAMLAANQATGDALASAVARASGDPVLGVHEPAKLTAEFGVAFFKFRVVHLAQAREGDAPMFLHRGGRIAGRESTDVDALRRWGDGLAANLAARRWPGPERYGIRGDYSPVLAQWESSWAPPGEQALCAYALLRYSRARWAEAAAASEARRTGLDILRALGMVEPGEPEPWSSPGGAGGVAVALSEVGAGGVRADAELAGLALRVREALAAAVSAEGAFAEHVSPGERAAVAAGIAGLYRLSGEAGDRELALAAIRGVYRTTPAAQLVGQMPWLGWAERLASPDADLVGAVPIRDARDLTWRHQITARDMDPRQADLVGGIVFTASRNPLPTWQTARPVAFFADALGDPRLTEPGEVPAELSRLLASMRFLRQLSADEAVCGMYPKSMQARWGVRAALWDQRMPPEATALALLGVAGALDSLETLAARGGPGGAGRE